MKTKNLLLAIRRYDDGKDIYIEIATSKGLTASDMIDLLYDLMEKLAEKYKLPVQYLIGIIHAGMGGDMFEQPTEEELKSIDKLIKELREEIEKNELHE